MNKNFLNKNKMGSLLQLTATILVILLGVVALSVQVTPAQAAGTVTDCTTYDGGPGSLKQALAGGGLVTFSCSGTIIVPEITINANTPTVIDATGYDVTLSGNNANRVFRVKSGKSLTLRNITIADGTTDGYGGGVYVEGGSLTVENSTFTGNSAAGPAGYGGAIYNFGTTTVNSSLITGNSSGNQAGAISNHGSPTLTGSLSLINSTVSGNTTAVAGGGLVGAEYSTTVLTNSTVTANSTNSSNGSGGGIKQFGDGAVTLSNTIIAGNTANSSGPDLSGTITSDDYNLVGDTSGAIFTPQPHDIVGQDPLLGSLADNGGPTLTQTLLQGSPAIDAGMTDLTVDQRGEARPFGLADDIGAFELQTCFGDSWSVANEGELNGAITCYNTKTVVGNYTITLTQDIPLTAGTTAIDNSTSVIDLVIAGDGFSVDGEGTSGVRPFEVAANTTVTMNELTVTGGNVVNAKGGGIFNDGTLTINDSEILENEAQGFQSNGGGIFNSGNLTLVRTIISDNDANIWYGGGVHNAGNLAVIDSTISGNAADRGGGIYNNTSEPAALSNSTISGNRSSNDGGGIYNTSAVSMTVGNSTVSGNAAGTNGGGILNTSADLTLDSVTITWNTASDGGALYNSGSTAQTTIKNSILANSVSPHDCFNASGTITDDGHNLVETQSACGFTNGVNDNIVGRDPVLGPLEDNGGETETHALLAGSPAIDTGDTTLTTDQRGEARPFGLADDIGAFELQTCFVDSWSVANEAELNAAIACYNTKTVAGSYTITLSQDILLTDRVTDRSTTAIDNATAGVELVIEGSGFAVDGQDNFDVRPFTIQANTTVTMNDLTATGGNVIGGGVDSRGGGILNRGNLTLNRSTVISNSTETRGGGLATQGGTVEINDSTIANNVSGTSSNPGNGGGLYNEDGQVTIRNSTISGNESDGLSSLGGGIANYHNMTLESVTITENGASDGGGIYFNTTSPVTLTIKNTILAGNGFDDCYFQTISGGATINDLGYNLVQADNQLHPCGFVGGVNNNLVTVPLLLPLAENGGSTQTHALDLDSPAIDAGDTSLPADQRGVARPQGAAADIGAFESTWCSDDAWSVSRLSQLDAAIDCFNVKANPGIYTINITQGFPAVASTTPIDNSTPGVSLVIEGSGNAVDWNGDLLPGTRPFLIQADTTVTINDLEINNGNVLGTERGGGILNHGNLTLNRSIIRGNRAEYNGGGISNYGVAVINDSTVAGNIIEGGSASVDGGGIHNEGSLTIRNSTISGNTSSNDGGGIGNVGTLHLDSVTVTANSAQGTVGGGAGAGVFIGASGTLTTRNSILAGNLDEEDCWAANPVTDGGHNLVGTQINCGFVDGVNGTIVGQDPWLDVLRDNGGPTLTHALLDDSPAIDAGATDLTTDQRGQPRPAGAADDIGAFELQSVFAFTLTVTTDGTGSGIVSSTPPGIDCSSDCSQIFTAGTVVTLTATPDSDSTFTGWSGACTNSTGNCIVTMDNAKSVTATFTKKDEHYNIYLPIIFN